MMLVAESGARFLASSINCRAARKERSGMTTLAADCPHCRRDKIGFALISNTFVHNRNFVFMLCGNCWLPAVAEMEHPAGPHQMPDVRQIPPSYNNWQVVQVWPEPPEPNLPEYLPDQVAKAFWQAEENFHREGMEDPSAGSYGRALDIGTKLIAPDFKGLLYARIKHLAETGRITKDLAEWAHEIRSIRNNALHEVDGIGREELTAVRGFADMTLRYLFTLPGMLDARKDEARAAR